MNPFFSVLVGCIQRILSEKLFLSVGIHERVSDLYHESKNQRVSQMRSTEGQSVPVSLR